MSQMITKAKFLWIGVVAAVLLGPVAGMSPAQAGPPAQPAQPAQPAEYAYLPIAGMHGSYKARLPLGDPPVQMGQMTFGMPQSVAVTADGRHVLVGDFFMNCVFDVDRTAGTVTRILGDGFPRNPNWHHLEPKAEDSVQPWDIAVARDGSVIVVDSKHNRVVRFDPVTKRTDTIADVCKFKDKAKALGMEKMGFVPSSVAVASDGSVVIADYDNRYILRLDKSGAIDVLARDLAVTSVAVGAGGAIYASERDKHRVVRIDPSSRKVTALIGAGVDGWNFDMLPAREVQLDMPSKVAVGSDGAVYVLDKENGRIVRADPLNRTAKTIAEARICPKFGELYIPASLAVDASGVVFVGESGGVDKDRLSRISALVKSPTVSEGDNREALAGQEAAKRAELLKDFAKAEAKITQRDQEKRQAQLEEIERKVRATQEQEDEARSVLVQAEFRHMARVLERLETDLRVTTAALEAPDFETIRDLAVPPMVRALLNEFKRLRSEIVQNEYRERSRRVKDDIGLRSQNCMENERADRKAVERVAAEPWANLGRAVAESRSRAVQNADARKKQELQQLQADEALGRDAIGLDREQNSALLSVLDEAKRSQIALAAMEKNLKEQAMIEAVFKDPEFRAQVQPELDELQNQLNALLVEAQQQTDSSLAEESETHARAHDSLQRGSQPVGHTAARRQHQHQSNGVDHEPPMTDKPIASTQAAAAAAAAAAASSSQPSKIYTKHIIDRHDGKAQVDWTSAFHQRFLQPNALKTLIHNQLRRPPMKARVDPDRRVVLEYECQEQIGTHLSKQHGGSLNIQDTKHLRIVLSPNQKTVITAYPIAPPGQSQ